VRVAPTSGAQDSQAINEAALNQAIADVKSEHWCGRNFGRDRARCSSESSTIPSPSPEEWTAARAAKGYDPTSPEGGEELFSGVDASCAWPKSFRRSMLDMPATGPSAYPGPVRHKPGDRIAIQVVPGSP